MGTTASKNMNALPIPEALPPSAEVLETFSGMTSYPPFCITFFYEQQIEQVAIQLPLISFDMIQIMTLKEIKGTTLESFERKLCTLFHLPEYCSVFAVVPADELYSPPFPLILFNTVAHHYFNLSEEDRPPLRFALIVRELWQINVPILRDFSQESPYFPIPASLLSIQTDDPNIRIQQQFARTRFVINLQRYGFARIDVSQAQADLANKMYESTRSWLQKQITLPPNERWYDFVNEADRVKNLSDYNGGRYIGFQCDPNREYLQFRQPLVNSGMYWPNSYFANDRQYALDLLDLHEMLTTLAHSCLIAVCEELNIDKKWMFSLLDDCTRPPEYKNLVKIDHNPSNQYGSSVLRIYNYRNRNPSSSGADAHNMALSGIDSCGVHADIGLLTVSPPATTKGLQMWTLEKMAWCDVEADAKKTYFSVFAGETLGYITHGAIKAPLHRVPPTFADSEETRRMSMPYFLRAKLSAILNPYEKDSDKKMTCQKLMEEVVLTSRPWRNKPVGSLSPDY